MYTSIHTHACTQLYKFVYMAIAYCLWPMTYCLMTIACCLLLTAYCLFPIAYCLLPIPHCLLPMPTAYCLVPTACCLLQSSRKLFVYSHVPRITEHKYGIACAYLFAYMHACSILGASMCIDVHIHAYGLPCPHAYTYLCTSFPSRTRPPRQLDSNPDFQILVILNLETTKWRLAGGGVLEFDDLLSKHQIPVRPHPAHWAQAGD